MPAPLTLTYLVIAVIALFINDVTALVALVAAAINQTLVEVALARQPVAPLEAVDE